MAETVRLSVNGVAGDGAGGRDGVRGGGAGRRQRRSASR